MNLRDHDIYFSLVWLGQEGLDLDKGISAVKMTKLLIEYSTLENLYIFISNNTCFYYSLYHKCYVMLTLSELDILLYKLMEKLDKDYYLDSGYIKRVSKQLCINGKTSKLGKPVFDRYLLFTDKALNLIDYKWEDLSPSIFVCGNLGISYENKGDFPKIRSFIEDLAGGLTDRINYIYCILYSILTNRIHNQVFILIKGDGSTGKSTLANLFIALVGPFNTVTTTLTSLSKDTFEVSNLSNKKLIIINDAELYKGDISILKQVVGLDLLPGREKHKQGSEEIEAEGMVVILSNHFLHLNDDTSALSRRQRILTTDKIHKGISNLINYRKNKISGEFVEELPSLIHYLIDMDPNKVDNTIRDISMVPSLLPVYETMEMNQDPLSYFIKHHCIKGKGSYIGNAAKTPKELSESEHRMLLYPAYLSFCKRFNILAYYNHNSFTESFIRVAIRNGYEIRKTRHSNGIYLHGVLLKTDFYTADVIYGGIDQTSEGIALEEGDNSEKENKDNKIEDNKIEDNKIEDKNKEEEEVNKLEVNVKDKDGEENDENMEHIVSCGTLFEKDLYKEYVRNLGYHKYKYMINMKTKGYEIGNAIEDIMNEFKSKSKISSELYIQGVKEQLIISFDKIKKNGLIPFKYKTLGISPRIIPTKYSETINSIKGVVRNFFYKKIAESKICSESSYVIVDFDLRSCFLSILIGLYPSYLNRLGIIIKGKGIWEYIRNNFVRNKKEHVYDKSGVKICLYSSFFQGGANAMIQGMMESFRKDLGLNQKEFKEFKDYEKLHKLAKDIAQEMLTSDIITEIRELSKHVESTSRDFKLIGPTGHEYKIGSDEFKRIFPNYLQSFEFAILARSTNELLRIYPRSMLIGHYHDGNVLLIKKEELNIVIDKYKELVTNSGKYYGFKYPIMLDVKSIYGIVT